MTHDLLQPAQAQPIGSLGSAFLRAFTVLAYKPGSTSAPIRNADGKTPLFARREGSSVYQVRGRPHGDPEIGTLIMDEKSVCARTKGTRKSSLGTQFLSFY